MELISKISPFLKKNINDDLLEATEIILFLFVIYLFKSDCQNKLPLTIKPN